jgi:AraC-like DNA-binding protein
MNSAAAPPFSLSRFVEDVRVFEAAPGCARRVDQLPNGRTNLIFRVLDGGHRASLSVGGPRTRAHFKLATGVERAVIVQLKPGWSASLLGVAAHALTDRIVPIEDIWGRAAAELSDELLAARSVPELLERLARAIALRTQQQPTFEPAAARLARRAVRLIEGGEVRVEHVAERLGVSARHLRRAFTESVGVGPKDFARSVRLQRALRLATLSRDWGRIAADAGYYDQAHLIADFRALVGLTPGAFAKRTGGLVVEARATAELRLA